MGQEKGKKRTSIVFTESSHNSYVLVLDFFLNGLVGPDKEREDLILQDVTKSGRRLQRRFHTLGTPGVPYLGSHLTKGPRESPPRFDSCVSFLR